MNITKLTLAPLFPNVAKVEIKNPDAVSATRLIKERMAYRSCYSSNVAKDMKHKKLPEVLRGFVNPDTWVSKFTDVSK